jgi:hypothetical protein
MTSYQLREHLSKVLELISTEHVLVKYIFILSWGYDQISEELSELLHLRNRAVFSKKQQVAQEKFFELRKQSESFPLGQIFHEAIQLQKELERLEEVFQHTQDKAIRELYAQVEHFYKAFESFAREATDQRFAELILEAAHLSTILASTRRVFSTIEQVLLPDEPEAPDVDRLALLLEEEVASLPAIVEKLSALQASYEELCWLVDVSLEEYPLQVAKVEAPNLWVCIEGERRVIGIMSALVGRYAQFMYSRFGSDGTTSVVSERVISTQSLVNLTDELERAGFNEVVRHTDRLQKSALALRRDLTSLMAEQPTIRVNGQAYAVDESGWAEFMSESREFMPPMSMHPLRETG